MRSRWQWIGVLAASMSMAGCQEPEPAFRRELISVDQLPVEFDAARTYHRAVGQVQDPEALLLELWGAGIHATRAWLPVDNLCFDPLGPRFTVELAQEDSRILSQGFERGDGRLRCATRLWAYTLGG